MTPTTEAFEALMPEPAYKITGKMGEFICIRAKSYDNKKGDSLYTADQLRAAMQAVWDAATERAAKQEREDGVIIAAFALPTVPGAIDQVRIERVRQMFGPDLWAVRLRGDVLNKQGEWEWEPMPSSRDDDFLARARFNTAEEGIAAAIRRSS